MLDNKFDARKLAKKEHVKITGTLGLLKMGYELCPIKDKLELQKIKTELRNTGFFMAPDIIEIAYCILHLYRFY